MVKIFPEKQASKTISICRADDDRAIALISTIVSPSETAP